MGGGDFIWIWYFKLFFSKKQRRLYLEFLNGEGFYSNQYKKGKFIKIFKIYIFHIDSDNILLDNINEIEYEKENSYFILNDWDEFHMTGL